MDSFQGSARTRGTQAGHSLTLKVGVQATLELFGGSTVRTLKELEKRLKRKVLALWTVAYVPHTLPVPIGNAKGGGRERRQKQISSWQRQTKHHGFFVCLFVICAQQ